MKWTAKKQYDVLETGICRNLHRVRVIHIINKIVAMKFKTKRPLRILDIGCGDGVITKCIKKQFPEEQIEAIDMDKIRLDRARIYCSGVTFQQGDIRFLPFRDCVFEIVLCHHVIEHIVGDTKVLDECQRVLVSGGLLILGIPHEGGGIGRILRLLHPKLYAESEHINFYSIGDMSRLLSKSGFINIEYAKFGFLFPHYYIHLLLLWNPITFKLGHIISQYVDFTADSVIFLANKVE